MVSPTRTGARTCFFSSSMASPGALDHALAQQPLDQAVGQCRRHELSLDRAFLAPKVRSVKMTSSIPVTPVNSTRSVSVTVRLSVRKRCPATLLPGESEAERLHQSLPTGGLRIGERPAPAAGIRATKS